MTEAAEKPVDAAKRPKQGRSPAYPGINLETAIAKAKALNDAEGKYAIPMASAFTAWGFAAKSSAGREIRAALKYYGLITLEGDGETGKVKLTEKALRVLLDQREDQTEKRALIHEMAVAPAIHARLFKEFPDGIKSDATVQHFLMFDAGYNRVAASELVTQFKATADYAFYKPDKVVDIKSGQSQDFVVPDPLKEPANVGDIVQVVINGAFQLEKPKRVRAIQDHDGKPWVFVDDHEAGVPMEQIEVIEKGTGAAIPPGQPPRLALPAKDEDGDEKTGVRKSRFALAEGDVVVTFPENLSADSVEDLDGFWQVFIKKARREAGIK